MNQPLSLPAAVARRENRPLSNGLDGDVGIFQALSIGCHGDCRACRVEDGGWSETVPHSKKKEFVSYPNTGQYIPEVWFHIWDSHTSYQRRWLSAISRMLNPFPVTVFLKRHRAVFKSEKAPMLKCPRSRERWFRPSDSTWMMEEDTGWHTLFSIRSEDALTPCVLAWPSFENNTRFNFVKSYYEIGRLTWCSLHLRWFDWKIPSFLSEIICSSTF